MRVLVGGVAHMARQIEADLLGRGVGLRAQKREALADITAAVLACRSVNTSELANVLPRDCQKPESSYRYINRFLASPLVSVDKVMRPFVKELIQQASRDNRTVVIMLDQSKIAEGFECLMLSIRIGNRAMPLLWRVAETKGNISFEAQKDLLNSFYKMLPEHADIMLAADRFYGTSMLVKWCKAHNFAYRIRIKGNIKFLHEGGEITGNDACRLGLHSIENAKFHETAVETNIGILQEEGFEEPWIIAMDCKPDKYKVLDYGMRWGIEAMFSDLKTRGFRITDTHLKDAKRIERLLLVLAIALFWAVSTAMAEDSKTPKPKSKKNGNEA